MSVRQVPLPYVQGNLKVHTFKSQAICRTLSGQILRMNRAQIIENVKFDVPVTHVLHTAEIQTVNKYRQ